MDHPNMTPTFDLDVQTLLQAELAAAARTPALRPRVLRPEPELGPRFVGYWRQLSALPRRTRRSLQRRWKRSLAAIALLMALGQAPALAATIAVDGSTCTLVDAITAANTDAATGGCAAGSGSDTLELVAGSTHGLTAVADTTYGASGLPLVTSKITITGHDSTIERAISGNDDPAFRLLAVSATGDLTLEGLTLRGGYIGGHIGGGCVYNRGALTISNSIVSGNRSSGGGGVANSGAGTVTITHSTVSGNEAAGGGGVSNYAGTVTITHSTISGNLAGARYGYGGSGGGVSNSRGTLTLTDSTISGNLCVDGIRGRGDSRGGGIFNHYGTLTLTNSTVSYNAVFGSDSAGGGGLENSGTLTLTNSTVSGNHASGELSLGGGVLNRNGGTLTLNNSTVSGNMALGIEAYVAQGSGGGVINYYGGTLNLSHSLISGNIANGVYSDRYPSEVVSRESVIISDDFNVFGTNGDPGVRGFSPGATDIVPSGPLGDILGPLADNGGPTNTHALVAGSPAVDAVGSGCPPPATDQRGFGRPADGDGDGGAECDVGAFELAAQPLPTCETAQPTRGCTVNGVANQLCQGTARGDQISGTPRDDIIFALDGNDRINGLWGNDLICGGKGNDLLRGKAGRDRIFGGPGDDNLQGGSGGDQLVGEAGEDRLFGDRGDDALDGGEDADRCDGGANRPAVDTAIGCETVFGVP